MVKRLGTSRTSWALPLILCVLLLRVLIPAGWMPATGADGSVRISICTGMGVATAWVDRDGTLHKEAQPGGHHDTQPCAFGALGLGLDETPALTVALPVIATNVVTHVARQTMAIGRGLAAPPPPSTGPPTLI